MRRIVRPALFAVAVAVAIAALFAAQPGESLPLYAARQGLMCQSCHFDPNGGGPRNEFGFMYARNRHSLEADTTGDWKDLDLVNRVSASMPVYFGVNQRFMLLSNAGVTANPAQRAGFFNMENALYVTFQPHPRLTLVYSRDAFNDAVLAQDAFGMISGFPFGGYLKAGRFRTPFGLRMDDHTVATRAGFLNLTGSPSFLPYDPRFPDMGLEIGADRGPWFARGSYTNGASNIFGAQPFAQATTAKLGYSRPGFQGAISLYDDYEKTGLFPFRRATRWSYYGLTRWRKLQLLGEMGAGTDFKRPFTPEAHSNLRAGFVEADWTFNKACNVRVRYDRLDTDRGSFAFTRPDGSTVTLAQLSTSSRWALEGELLPVPFGELRWAYRVIVPAVDHDQDGFEIKRERQGFLQFHFSY